MTSDADRYILSIIDDIRSVEAGEWNRLAAPETCSPFLEHEFLASFEASGCAAPENGWYPRHFILKDSGRLIAAAPAYARTHSMGDFIFDQGLAQAAAEMGKDYYPKLIATLPFTPSPGYRFLVDSDYDESAITGMILSGMKSYAGSAGLHSVSILFADPAWHTLSGALGENWLRWVHQYFLWENPGYTDFEDYMSRFAKNQRRNIRRERESVRDQGIRVEIRSGGLLNESLMDKVFDFYESTNRQFGPWAAFFLNREWFRDIGKRWSNRILVFTALREGSADPIAMSLLVRKNSHLIGRYWGASEFVRNLHFELCYYAPIDFAIAEGLDFFDPGMGSPHKARRGFGSREFSTYHDIFDREISALFSSVLPEANRGEREAIRELDGSIPWISGGDS